MAADLQPTGKDFYIVYEDSKKTSFLATFLAGTNPKPGQGGEREASTKYSSEQINVFSTINDYNTELENLGQPILTWNPYTEEPPSFICNQNDDGDCA